MGRPKLEVADVFRRYGEAYREKHGASMSTAQRRIMTAIEVCRTAALGGQIEQCDQCGHQRICYRSCRNRHCPKCQSLARAEWIQRRQAELLDCQYFHVVFTLPEEIAAIAYQNKKVVYSILFRSTAETLRTIAMDPKHLGAEIGFFAVLHTWGSNLLHHPHLHCVVPGGGLSPDGTHWISCRRGFFLAVRVLSRLFRRLFLEHLQHAFDAGKLQFFTALEKLRDRRQFDRRFLLHALPNGFQRIRYYGLLGNRYRQEKLARCRQLLGMAPPVETPAPQDYRDQLEQLTGSSLRQCPVCHRGSMVMLETLTPRRSPEYVDTS
jgi:Transposase zinc-binding domain/Putative transposase